MKSARHRKIIELIEKYDIETQEELANYLNAEGIDVTQATVSRDIRQLQLIKLTGEGTKQKYGVMQNNELAPSEKYNRILKDGLVSMDWAGNILVIKTVSGMAMAVAAAVDAMNINGIIGSIAGDDTIMCAIKDAKLSAGIVEHINHIIS